MKEELLVALYQEKAPIIGRYLVGQGCASADAEDIVQDVFFKAVAHMIYLQEENLSAWLFKVAVNRYYDLCRKKNKHPEIQVDQGGFIENFLNENLLQEDQALAGLLDQEKSDQVRQILEGLSAINRNLLLLKYDLELSYKRIGQLLDMEETKVKTYLYRARQDFRKGWEERYGKDERP